MACNCKNKNIVENETISEQLNLNTIIKYALKIIGFLISLALLPFINIILIYFIFNVLVLNKNVDLKPILSFIGNKFRNNSDDDMLTDDEINSLTEDDVILLDAEDITKSDK